jgi:predicted dienelactone hydrolase
MIVRLALLAPLLTLLLCAPARAAILCDAVWRDSPRGRDLPVRIRLPAGTDRVPAVIYSPGLGGTRTTGEMWAAGWAAAGVAVIQTEHPGSDAAVYANIKTQEERVARVRAGASSQQLLARIGDIGFILDELGRRPQEGICNLARIDPDRLGLAGHSMGAWVVQAMAGQRLGPAGARLQDMRLRAFIALSPTANPAIPPDTLFGGIHRPFLVLTGTRDGVPDSPDAAVRSRALAQRTGVFAGLPADGRKAQALFDQADHMMFAGNRRAAGDAVGQHVQAASLAISTAWWRRWLLGDARAEAVLAAPPVAPADQWQRK